MSNIIIARQALAAQVAQDAIDHVNYDASAAARELAEQSFGSLQFEWRIDNF